MFHHHIRHNIILLLFFFFFLTKIFDTVSSESHTHCICTLDEVRLPSKTELLFAREYFVDELAVENGDLRSVLSQFL